MNPDLSCSNPDAS